MKRMQSGFTLIELIVVVVILGILAVTAVPRFIDLSADARDASLQGVIGAIESGAAINYAACQAGNAGCQTTLGTACTTAIPAILDKDPGYTYAAGTTNDLAGTATVGEVGTCTVTDPDDNTVTGEASILAAN